MGVPLTADERRDLELAWSWLKNREFEVELRGAMTVPPVFNKKLADDVRTAETTKRQNRRRRVQLRAEEGAEGDFSAFVEMAVDPCDAARLQLGTLVDAAQAMDYSSNSITIASFVRSFLHRQRTREGALSSYFTAEEDHALAQSLAELEATPKRRHPTIKRRSAGPTIGYDLGLEAARSGPGGVLTVLLRWGGIVAKVAALATIIDVVRCSAMAAADLGPLVVADVVPLATQDDDLVAILAVSCIAELVTSNPIEMRHPLIDNGAVAALITALRTALPGAKTIVGDATPRALHVPRKATMALCALCDDDDDDKATRKAAIDSGALDVCIAVLQLQPEVSDCRLAQEAALRFVAMVLTLDDDVDHIVDKCATGILALVTSPEVKTRKAALSTISYIARAATLRKKIPSTSSSTSSSSSSSRSKRTLPAALLEHPAFLRGLAPMLRCNDVLGDLLRILLFMAANRVSVHDRIFDEPLTAIVMHRRHSCLCRTLALRTLFAIGAFDLFTTTSCLASDPELHLELTQLTALVEPRSMQLAYLSRPEIEDKFSKDEKSNYMDLFCEAASFQHGERAVSQKQVLPLLKKCCAATGDKITPKNLSRRTVRAICEIYDTDRSGLLEWSEFLYVLKDLREGALTQALLK